MKNKEYNNIVMNQRQTIKLNENQLRQIVKESVKKFLNEEMSDVFNVNLSVELYHENGIFGAYIGEENSSGYDCTGGSPQECAEQVAQYIIDAFNR